VVFRQEKLLSISFAVIFLAILLWDAVTPQYQAEMRFLVQRERFYPVVTAQPAAPQSPARLEITDEELNSEAELLKDAGLLRKVALAVDAAPRRGGDAGKPSREEEVRIARAAERLASRLKVEPVRKTNLIRVDYSDSSPARAARVLQSLGALYLEKHREVHRPAGQWDFFEQQTEHYHAGLKAAQLELQQFTRTEGVVSAAAERDINLQKLAELENQARQTLVSLAEAGQRVQELETQVASTPERSTTQVRTSDNPYLLEQLKSTLLRLQMKRTELLTKFQPTYRLVQEVEQQIADTRAAIVAAERTPVREEVTDRDPNHQWARGELAKAQLELHGLQARAVAANFELGRYHTRVQRLGEQAVVQQDLERSATTAEENYLLYLRKREEARIGDALDQRNILNVALVEAPVAPPLPTRSPAMVLALALLAAGVGSTGLAFAADYLDPAFRTPDEVATHLGVPVLASLPQGLRPMNLAGVRAGTETRFEGVS
jgi:uncharacterized protein involved in exopolysaccharide biosynthesis